MPRKPRMYVPGMPAHVVQRGNNRRPTFFDDQDYDYYLEVLSKGLVRYRADLHAYALMTNPVHMLITPGREDSIARVFQHVGRLYVLYVNKKYRRTGSLWEGRYKCSLVDADKYLLTCYRYIELNPVVAGMVEKPEEYRWSSYLVNGVGMRSQLIQPHDIYLGLGDEIESRCRRYRELFETEIADESVHKIRKALKFNYPLGNDKFRQEIENYLGRTIGKMEGGRPGNPTID